MTDGWTGRPCPHCRGTGSALEDDGQSIRCPACSGTGQEWGEIEDEPTIREPGAG